jgi:hypothetical protein
VFWHAWQDVDLIRYLFHLVPTGSVEDIEEMYEENGACFGLPDLVSEVDALPRPPLTESEIGRGEELFASVRRFTKLGRLLNFLDKIQECQQFFRRTPERPGQLLRLLARNERVFFDGEVLPSDLADALAWYRRERPSLTELKAEAEATLPPHFRLISRRRKHLYRRAYKAQPHYREARRFGKLVAAEYSRLNQPS